MSSDVHLQEAALSNLRKYLRAHGEPHDNGLLEGSNLMHDCPELRSSMNDLRDLSFARSLNSM